MLRDSINVAANEAALLAAEEQVRAEAMALSRSDSGGGSPGASPGRLQRAASARAMGRRGGRTPPPSTQLQAWRSPLKALRVVFFMHLPFPTSQIFRTLPRAQELIRSLTCADVVGFHAFDHARHFLNTAKRMLGFRSASRPGGMLTLHVPDADREVIVSVSHVSIQTTQLDAVAAETSTAATTSTALSSFSSTTVADECEKCTEETAEKDGCDAEQKEEKEKKKKKVEDALSDDPLLLSDVQLMAQALRRKYAGRKIVVGVDVCQRLSGVALKLAAFDKLLSDSSYGADGRVVLLQRCVRGCGRPGDEETTGAELRKMAADINARCRARRREGAYQRRPAAQWCLPTSQPLWHTQNNSSSREKEMLPEGVCGGTYSANTVGAKKTSRLAQRVVSAMAPPVRVGVCSVALGQGHMLEVEMVEMVEVWVWARRRWWWTTRRWIAARWASRSAWRCGWLLTCCW